MITLTLRVLNQLVLGSFTNLKISLNAAGRPAYEVTFRCWPIDMDFNFHINNACYIRIAELARWRNFPKSNMFEYLKNRGVMFLVTEQHIKYFKPIMPFQKYIVSTSIATSQDKWFHYKHTFLQHPSDVEIGKPVVVYAEIDCRAVLKEKSGKTIKPSSFLPFSSFFKEMCAGEEIVRHDESHNHQNHTNQ